MAADPSEARAHDLVRQKEWLAALQLYDRLLLGSTCSPAHKGETTTTTAASAASAAPEQPAVEAAPSDTSSTAAAASSSVSVNSPSASTATATNATPQSCPTASTSASTTVATATATTTTTASQPLASPAAGSGSPSNAKPASRDHIIGCLVGRSECALELRHYEAVVSDARWLLQLLASASADGASPGDAVVCSSTAARCRRRLVHALYRLRRYGEAEAACREWLQLLSAATSPAVHANSDMYKVRAGFGFCDLHDLIDLIVGTRKSERRCGTGLWSNGKCAKLFTQSKVYN